MLRIALALRRKNFLFVGSFKEADVNLLPYNFQKLKNMHLDRRIRLFQSNKSYNQKLFFGFKFFSDWESFYYRFYLVHLYRIVRIGEYIFLRGVVYGKCYIFRCFYYFYFDKKIVNLSGLFTKKLESFCWLK